MTKKISKKGNQGNDQVMTCAMGTICMPSYTRHVIEGVLKNREHSIVAPVRCPYHGCITG